MKLLAALIILAVGERLIFDLGPNVELVTMATVLAAIYSTHRLRYLVPVVIMVLTDWKLGIGQITWFTWSGFVMMAIIPQLTGKWLKPRFVNGLTAGIIGTIWFFVWTNGGVWLTDGWGRYSRDIWGLYQCYLNGLPFLRNQLLSTLIWVPVGLAVLEASQNKSWRSVGEKLGLA